MRTREMKRSVVHNLPRKGRLGAVARLALVLALLTSATGVIHASDRSATKSTGQVNEDSRQQTLDAYSRLLLHFVANQGQADERVAYYVQQGGANIYFTAGEMVMALPETVLRLWYVDANPHTRIVGTRELEARFNYFIGNDPEQWRSGIPTYGEIQYHDLYPGIDLVYNGRTGALKYTFVVQPGANIDVIRLAYAGADGLRLAENGDLVITTAAGELRDAAPYVYQEIDGTRVEIESTFALYDAYCYGFVVGDYDPRYPLVIDPGLAYSTFLGGAGHESGDGIAVDASGHVYVTGYTTSAGNFPTTSGAYAESHGGGTDDAFVSVLNPAGGGTADLLYSTFLGGNNDDWGYDIAVNGSGYAYVTGSTHSTNFPTTSGAYDETHNGGVADAFVSVLSPAGSGTGDLLYSTFLGGSMGDRAYGIAVDSSGYAYVAGNTAHDFPTTTGAFDESLNGNGDAFVSVLNPAGGGTADLLYSTYLGGNNQEEGYAIVVDGSGYVYVTGFVWSENFPTTSGAYDQFINGWYDVFVSMLNPAGGGTSDLLYSTYLGGTNYDYGYGIAVSSFGNIYVTGSARTGGFPTTSGAYDETHNGGIGDAFVSVLAPVGGGAADLLYSTFLGGSGYDQGSGIAVDGSGYAHVTGYSTGNYPTTPGAYDETHNGNDDVFVSMLDPAGGGTTDLLYSTFLGGTASERGNGIALDGLGYAHVTGYTDSGGFPTTSGAFDGSHNSWTDVFVSKFGSPTAVELVSFTATAADDGRGILLQWETASEVDHLGFNLYRATGNPHEEYVQLNEELIPSQAPGSPVGAIYTWLDESAALEPGVVYDYWLEAVDIYGQAATYGPVQGSLPTARYRCYLPQVHRGP